MPFTFSHAAASLPLLKRAKSVGWAPALVFGTLVPDLLFPIPHWGDRAHTHSLSGLFLLDTPVAVLAAAMWVFVLAKRASRLPGLSTLGRARHESFSLVMTLLGALVGSATHLAWDLFTHQGSPLTEHPFFAREIFAGDRGQLTIQSAIWYANSLLGVAVLLGWAHRHLHARGEGLRSVFLAGPWLRIYAAFVAPYLVILRLALRPFPDSLGQLIINLAYLLDAVRMAMAVSIVLALAVAAWETRSPRRCAEAPA